MDTQTDTAIRSALGSAKMRPNDDTFSSTAVSTWLKDTHGIETTVTDGIVEFKQGETLISTPAALRKFADANASYFVSEGDDPKNWDARKKSEWIAANGFPAWEAKVGSKPLRADVDVANIDISKAEYLSMTRQEKTRWIGNHGVDAVQRVMAKAK